MLALLTTGATASVPQEGARNPYLYREQETALFGMGYSPSSAIQDQIGSQSTKGIHFLHRAGLSASSPRVWSSGTVTAIETYPAPAKTVKDLFDTRERMLDTYLETGQLPWVARLLRTTRGEDLSPPQAPRLLGKGSSASVTAEQCTFPPRDDYDDEGDISKER